jgi:hypothetical protein
MPVVVPTGLLARPQPIEEAFPKVKGILREAKARTLDALFGHCGYATTQDHSL